MSDNPHSRNLDLAVRTSRTFPQISHKLGIPARGGFLAFGLLCMAVSLLLAARLWGTPP